MSNSPSPVEVLDQVLLGHRCSRCRLTQKPVDRDAHDRVGDANVAALSPHNSLSRLAIAIPRSLRITSGAARMMVRP